MNKHVIDKLMNKWNLKYSGKRLNTDTATILFVTRNNNNSINNISEHYFSNNCSLTSINEHTTKKKTLKITDFLGRETKGNKNQPLFYIYDDGTVEKKITID